MVMKYLKVKTIVFTIPNAPDEKHWVKVIFENSTEWLPALVDIADILSKIGKCEDMKYPSGEGYKFTLRFITKSFNKSRRQIAEMYIECFNPNKLKFSK